MRTEDVIIRLVESVRPVRPLAPPIRRLGRWSAGAFAVTIIGVAIIGTRPDSAVVARQLPFLTLAGMIIATAVVAAAVTLVLAIPGAERSAIQRWAPLGFSGVWALMLVVSVLSAGSATDSILALPVHAGCVIQIAALALLPGWGLFTMVRNAAPLQRGWSAGLATLAAVSLAAAGTQFICPIDAPAHHLVGHFVPVAAFACVGAWFGQHVLRRSN